MGSPGLVVGSALIDRVEVRLAGRQLAGHLDADHVALETTAYSTWEEDFEPRLRAAVAATAEHVQPALERYR
jgi:hypothetical protein